MSIAGKEQVVVGKTCLSLKISGKSKTHTYEEMGFFAAHFTSTLPKYIQCN